MGITPLKSHALAKTTQIKAACDKLEVGLQKRKEMIRDIYELPNTPQLEDKKEIQRKADNFDKLMYLMKEKLTDKSLKTSQKMQVLTMAPDWLRAQVAKFFNVSEYMVRKARKLAKEKGIMALPDPQHGNFLPKEVEESVKHFYEDDEYSRLLPGSKDYVSVARNIYKQKRLILCNLRELYQAYKEKFPHHKIGLSKFCELRPKWCITVSSAGTHSVCVCTIHQNTKLMVDAFCNTINNSIKKLKSEFYEEQIEENHSSNLIENENDVEHEEDFRRFHNMTYQKNLPIEHCKSMLSLCSMNMKSMMILHIVNGRVRTGLL